jgi:molybdopterin molybdotransferase
MVSVEQAYNIIRENIQPLAAIPIKLEEAAGYVLDTDIFSPVNVPGFLQSSMDGYAFAYTSGYQDSPLQISGMLQAGSSELMEVTVGKAVRIFTGAPLPQGADTVVMQEKTILQNHSITITDSNLIPGVNVRQVGADILKDSLTLTKGTLLNPATIGVLASMGLSEVTVINQPSLHIIVTGNELQAIGKPLTSGQVYESNSPMLVAALQQLGIKKISVEKVSDSLDNITTALQNSIAQSDVTLLVGGISVGDYDFVLEATQRNGVEPLFYKVKQKPGKPLYLGKKGKQVVVALPGNPASALSCFYLYVTRVIDALSGTQNAPLIESATIINDYQKPAGFTHFLKGYYNRKQKHVHLLTGQESYKMHSFAQANCFVELGETITEVKKGEIVEIHLW